MSDESEEVVPDQPLDTLVDEVDNEVREETRETSRRWRSACAWATPPPRPD
jgi:hypothetical protein